MKSFALRARAFTALLVIVVLLASPIAVLAKKGEKNFRRGMEFEQAQQWEKAAQEFALAVAASPSDTEYQLHYRRSVFNASQSYMAKGKALAEQNDYVGAYNAFRQAYGLDPVNDLAAQEMDRMLRLQREKEGVSNPTKTTRHRSAGRWACVAYSPKAKQTASPWGRPHAPSSYRPCSTTAISKDLYASSRTSSSLNVVFDQNFSQVKRTVNIKWKDITPARALDYVFLSQGLFFQKLDRRTITSRRPVEAAHVPAVGSQNLLPLQHQAEEAQRLLQGRAPPGQRRTTTAVHCERHDQLDNGARHAREHTHYPAALAER